MVLEETVDKMNQMRLKTMAISLRERLNRGDHQDLSHEEMISLIVDDEWMARENRKLERRLKEAKFKVKAGLESIDYELRRGLVKRKNMDLSTLRWIEKHQDILILGPTGVGKSFIAQAIGHHACQRGYATHYIRLSKLLYKSHLAKAEGTSLRHLSKMAKFDVLILDDWGIGTLKAQERKDVLDLIEERHEVKSTIVTSQLPIQHWHEFIGDETIADAICDRLAHNAYTIELKGESVRKMRGGDQKN